VTIWQSVLTTASELYEPRNWWGIAGLLIVNLGVIVTAICTGVVLVRQRGVQRDTSEVKAQVVNGRADKDPLRADVDKALDGIARIEGQVDGLYRMLEALFDRPAGADRRHSDHPHGGPERRSGHDRRQ